MKYWFRKRRGLMSRDLGWGWIPISTEGWIMTLLLIFGLYNFVIMEAFKWIGFGLLSFMYIADLKTEDKVLFKGGKK